MERAVKTYLDANVLINALDTTNTAASSAAAVINDEHRQFIVSDYVWLEVFPQMFVNKRFDQISFAEEFFTLSAKVPSTSVIVAQAKDLAKTYGLSAMDALHVASAIDGKADEFLTSHLLVLFHRIVDVHNFDAGFGEHGQGVGAVVVALFGHTGYND